MERTIESPRMDRRSVRTRNALREALSAEVASAGDLSQVTVTAVADRAGVTRRTFYSHYRDIPDLVGAIEDEALCTLSSLAREIAQVTLPELEEAINSFEPCPRSVEILEYFQNEGSYLVPLLGEGGDPAFAEKIKTMVREVVEERALHGFTPLALHLFDYYLTFVISAEVGVLIRWLTTGMTEPAEIMARVLTALMFVRPGDLYGRPIDFDVPSLAGMALTLWKESTDVSSL